MWYAGIASITANGSRRRRHQQQEHAIQKAHAICTRIRGEQPDAPKQNTTLKQITDGYVELMKAQGRAPTTITKYDLVARNVIAWSNDEAASRATLNKSDFWSIRKFLIDTEGVGDKTAYDRLVVVKQMMKWAVRQHLIGSGPFAGLSMSKRNRRSSRASRRTRRRRCWTERTHFKPMVAMPRVRGSALGEARSTLDRSGPGQRQPWLHRRTAWRIIGQDYQGQAAAANSHPYGTAPRVGWHAAPLRAAFSGYGCRAPSIRTAGRPWTGNGCLVITKRLCKRCGFASRSSTSFIPSGIPSRVCTRGTTSPYKYAWHRWMGHRSSDILDLLLHV